MVVTLGKDAHSRFNTQRSTKTWWSHKERMPLEGFNTQRDPQKYGGHTRKGRPFKGLTPRDPRRHGGHTRKGCPFKGLTPRDPRRHGGHTRKGRPFKCLTQRDPRRHGGHTRKGRPFKGLTHKEIHEDMVVTLGKDAHSRFNTQRSTKTWWSHKERTPLHGFNTQRDPRRHGGHTRKGRPLKGLTQRDPRRHGGHTRKGRPFKGLTHKEIHEDMVVTLGKDAHSRFNTQRSTKTWWSHKERTPLHGFNTQRDPRRHGGHTRKGRPLKGLTPKEIHKNMVVTLGKDAHSRV